MRNYNDKAERMYTIAKKIREDLGLDASEKHVYLLNNLGRCKMFSNRANEAIETLEKARDMADKLAKNDNPNHCKAKVYTSLAFAHHSAQKYSQNAVKYAKKAMEFEQLRKVLSESEFNKIKEISHHVII